MNKYIEKVDDAARQHLRKIAYAYKDLERAEKLVKEAEQSRVERRILNARGELLDAQDAVKKARNEAVAAMDQLRVMRNELVQDAAARNTVNPEAVDMAALELMKSGIMQARDYDAMLNKYGSNPTMTRLISKYAGDAVDAMKEDTSARAALMMTVRKAREMVNPEAEVVDFDGVMEIFARSINNRHMIKHYDELAAPFTGITNPGNPLSEV